jgi:hypothetical protein
LVGSLGVVDQGKELPLRTEGLEVQVERIPLIETHFFRK